MWQSISVRDQKHPPLSMEIRRSVYRYQSENNGMTATNLHELTVLTELELRSGQYFVQGVPP